MRLRQTALRTKIILGSCVPLILFSILIGIAWGAINSLLEGIRWVNHTHQVNETAMDIKTSSIDMETGMRGFMLSGKDEFLAPYNSGSKRFFDLTRSLKATVRDNPEQVALLEEIEQNMSRWRDEVARANIEFRRSVGDNKTMDDVVVRIGEARGKTYFDTFRDQISTFIAASLPGWTATPTRWPSRSGRWLRPASRSPRAHRNRHPPWRRLHRPWRRWPT